MNIRCELNCNNTCKPIATLIVWLILVFIGSNLAFGATYVSDFYDSFEGWQWQWHCPTCGEYVEQGEVFLSSERGYGDGWSLLFDMGNGAGDNGTLWVEKPFFVPANMPVLVSVSFQLYNSRYSDFNRFRVKAYIGQDNPEEQANFTTIGETNTAAGWVSFSYENTVNSNTGEIWVALGIRVSWETHREYWIDHVVVIVPLVGDLDNDEDVDFVDYAIFAERWLDEPCDADNDYCEGADLDQFGTVDANDLGIFTETWLAGADNS